MGGLLKVWNDGTLGLAKPNVALLIIFRSDNASGVASSRVLQEFLPFEALHGF